MVAGSSPIEPAEAMMMLHPSAAMAQAPSKAGWTHAHTTVIDKIRAKVVEKRVRLFDHFRDFDALRSGFCTISKLNTVLTVANIRKDIDQSDFESLVGQYWAERPPNGGLFSYVDFCTDINRAFTMPGLVKDPLASCKMPDASTTLPARRNRLDLPLATVQKVAELEERIKCRVSKHRANLRPAFKDMDRNNTGHVTRSQFARVMSMLSFELDSNSVDLLAAVYCDLGNSSEFNYIDFCLSCDPCELTKPVVSSRDLSKFSPMSSPRPLALATNGNAIAYPRYIDCGGKLAKQPFNF